MPSQERRPWFEEHVGERQKDRAVVKLRGMTWEHERGYRSVVESSKHYGELNEEVEISWEFRSLQNFADQPLEVLAEQYDLLVIDHPHIPHAAQNGILANLRGVGFDDQLEILASQNVGKSHISYQHNGGQYGLASDAAAQVSAYRPDLIDSVPKNWEEVLSLAETGKVIWPYKPVDSWSSLITVASGNGEEPMRNPGLFLTRKGLEEAFGTLKRLAQLVPEDNQFWNPIEAADALAKGSKFQYCPLLFGYTNYSRVGYRENRIAYTNIPESTRGLKGSLLGGAGITVSNFSRNRDHAIAFAFWLASAEVQEGVYYESGGQPGNSFAWESEKTNSDCLNFFKNTRETLEGAYLRPREVDYIELQNELSPFVTEALTSKMSIDELEERLNKGVQKWFKS